jgi:hypothetical protein
MAADDFDVVVFKLLSYLYTCLKAGVEPRGAKALEISGCNSVYFKAVLKSLKNDGLINGNLSFAWGGDPVLFDISITQSGARYVSENAAMKKAARFLGQAFLTTLELAVAATAAL